MLTPFQKMRAHRVRWVAQPIKATDDAWRLKAMVFDGQMYVEAPATMLCTGCAFYPTLGDFPPVDCCDKYRAAARAAFGRDCDARVIYIAAE